MQNLVIRDWKELSDQTKYGIPTDVQAILDRLQRNVSRYVANYLIIGGKSLFLNMFLCLNSI